MARRIVFIEGLKLERPKQDEPEDFVVGSADLNNIDRDFNYRSNLVRGSGAPVRHGNDYWPVVQKFTTPVELSLGGLTEVTIMEQIDPSGKPPGCDEIWHMLPRYAERNESGGASRRVWALTVRTDSGYLRAIYMRAAIREPKALPIAITQVVSQNIRPLDKIRFPGEDYFIPEREFCYVGFPYR